MVKASTPVSDILRIGATVGTFNRDGFGHNILNGRQNYNKDVMAGRVSARTDPDRRPVHPPRRRQDRRRFRSRARATA